MDDERGDGATSEKPHAIHLVPFFASSCLSSELGGRCDALMRDGGGVFAWRPAMAWRRMAWMGELPRTARRENGRRAVRIAEERETRRGHVMGHAGQRMGGEPGRTCLLVRASHARGRGII